MDRKSILLVYAHPDDESFSAGGTIAKYAAQGVEIRLLCATRGEAGKTAGVCEADQLGQIREAETREAAKVLGIREVHFLDYRDKELSKADPLEAALKIARVVREFRPEVVITFGPDGSSGHQDHIAIHHYTVSGLKLAARPDLPELPGEPFRVPRVYYPAFPSRIKKALGHADSNRSEPDTVIDTAAFATSKTAALKCHRTQGGSFNKFLAMGEEKMAYYLGREFFRLDPVVSRCQEPGRGDLFGDCPESGRAAAN